MSGHNVTHHWMKSSRLRHKLTSSHKIAHPWLKAYRLHHQPMSTHNVTHSWLKACRLHHQLLASRLPLHDNTRCQTSTAESLQTSLTRQAAIIHLTKSPISASVAATFNRQTSRFSSLIHTYAWLLSESSVSKRKEKTKKQSAI